MSRPWRKRQSKPISPAPSPAIRRRRPIHFPHQYSHLIKHWHEALAISIIISTNNKASDMQPRCGEKDNKAKNHGLRHVEIRRTDLTSTPALLHGPLLSTYQGRHLRFFLPTTPVLCSLCTISIPLHTLSSARTDAKIPISP